MGTQNLLLRQASEQQEEELAEAFRAAGWQLVHAPHDRVQDIDMVVKHGSHQYAVEFKSAPEGRRDRLVPLLAQAILQAQVGARRLGGGVVPLAVVAAPRVSESVLKEVRRFAEAYAPGVAIGVIDREGRRSFSGEGLESINAARSPRPVLAPSERGPTPHLFPDLNQWMLKLLLAPHIPADLLSAPRAEFRNASQLAQAANVSSMSASRFIRQLKAEGFLDESTSLIRLVRVGDLLSRWRAALLRSSQEWPMRWVIRGDAARQLENLLQSSRPEALVGDSKANGPHRRPRICLGYFAAAEQLGFGFVHGIKPHVYVERLDVRVLQRLGLAQVQPGEAPDVNVRVPLAPQAVFRAAVWRHGLPVADILQVWLDVGNHPARGQAQAAEIEHRLLGPLLAAR